MLRDKMTTSSHIMLVFSLHPLWQPVVDIFLRFECLRFETYISSFRRQEPTAAGQQSASVLVR